MSTQHPIILEIKHLRTGARDMRQQRDDLSEEMERCHRLLDVHYGEDLNTAALDTLEDRLTELLSTLKK